MAGDVRVTTDLRGLAAGLVDDVTRIVDEECRAGRNRVLEQAQRAWPVGETGDSREGLQPAEPYGIRDGVRYAGYVRLHNGNLAADELVVAPLVREAEGPVAEAIARRVTEGRR